ncbi:hypothetical protein OC845_002665 [Tilletia horrida]|nr:hypothetical protein OC845_002665 [Tilletia horrida]
MASLEATRPAGGSPGAAGALTPTPSATPSVASTPAAGPSAAARSLSPPPPRPISPLISRPHRHQNHVLPPLPDHEPGDVPSPITGPTIHDRRQQTQHQNQPRPIRKLRLPPSRTNPVGLGAGVAGNNPSIPGLASVRSNQQQSSQNLNTPTPASISMNSQRASNHADEEEVEEVLEELEDEPESEHLSANLEQSAQSDVSAACLSVQNATAAALRSCVNSMLSLSMPEGNIDSSNPVATVQILNQILQSTFSFSSSSNSPAPSFSVLSRQLKQIAAQQPLLASSEDLALSHALINLLAALQTAREAPSPPPPKVSPASSESRNKANEERQAESPVLTEFSPTSPPPTGEQGTSKVARRLSNNTVSSSPAASDELRDPFAESRHQDEFSILLRRLNTLGVWVPDSRASLSGSELGSPAGSSTTSLNKSSLSPPGKADPWVHLGNAVAHARELVIVKKRTAPSQRSHSFSDSPMSPTMLSHGLSAGISKGQSRSRSTSRRGSVSSMNSPITNADGSSGHLPAHPGASHDALLGSSSSGRQSTQSLRSSSFSTAGTLAEAPTWLSAGNQNGSRPLMDRRNSLSSTTDVNSTVGPHKNSTDSLVDPYLVRAGKGSELRKDELAGHSRPGSYHSAADEKPMPGRHSEDSLASGYGASEVDYDVLKERQRRKKTLASELDTIEHNLGRLFSAAPPLNDQRAEPPRVRPKSAASDSLTIQNGSTGLQALPLARPVGKEKVPEKPVDYNSPEAIQGRTQTLRDVIDKLGRPRMEDQRMAPPILKTPMFFDDDPVIVSAPPSKQDKYGSVGKHSTKDGIGSVPKLATSYDERPGLSGSHARSLSQRLVDVVSFKRGRAPASPLHFAPGTEPGSSKSLRSQNRTGSMSSQSQEAALAASWTKQHAAAEGDEDDEMDFLEFMQRASGRSMDEQRHPSRTRAPAVPKKLAKLGLDKNNPRMSAEDPDTDLFEQLIQTSTRARFSDQEAEFRPHSSTSAKINVPPLPYDSTGGLAYSAMPGSAPSQGPPSTFANSRALSSATFQRPLPPSLPSEMYRSTHRVTHSVPMAAYNPPARDDHAAPEMSMKYAKAPALATTSAIGGAWHQGTYQPSSSHHQVPMEHTAFSKGAVSAQLTRGSMDDYHEDDALDEAGYSETSAQDFRARLSDLPSPSGSLSPVVGMAQRGASSGWVPSATPNRG